MEEKEIIERLIEKIDEVTAEVDNSRLDISEFSEDKKQFLKKYGHI